MTVQTITRTLDYTTQVQTGASTEAVEEEVNEFDRLAELAGELVQMPKTELDEKREQGG